ncbi:hypothetical protein DFQ26_009598 [Actinomortierella ambigua]|nr:hypothetical protein DFQ26_009598 [Actinomortierella ambigua]
MNISRNSRLQVDFGRLVNNKEQSDIKFIIVWPMGSHTSDKTTSSTTDGKPIHRLILSCFQAHWKEASEGVFRKPNIEPKVFDIILQYLYTGQLKAPWNLLTQLIEAALELRLGDLVSGCEEFASQAITEETVFRIIAMSFHHDLSELQSKVLEFFDENARSLVKIDGLFTLDQDTLVTILSRDTVELDELEVWETIVRYAYHRNGHNHKCCPLLQFPEPPGRIVVKVSKVDEVDLQESSALVGGHAYSADESSLLDYGLGDTSIGSKDVAVVLRQDHFQNLRATVQPLLPAFRLVNLEVADFARCIEGTGLIPADLCRRMYRYYALPVGHPEYFPSPRRPRSKLLPHRQWLTLLSWIAEAANSRPMLKSLFKATVHGFDSKTFHARCDHQGPTLTIVRTTSGVLVGGYNEKDWTSSGLSSYATKNFLFRFDPQINQMARAVLKNDYDSRLRASVNSPNYGPTFGGGDDLSIAKHGKTVNMVSRSYEGISWRPNLYTISDYEVLAILTIKKSPQCGCLIA